MTESTLIKAVNRGIPKSIHHQSMTGATMTSNGVPDRYYDGPRRDLWVEFKLRTAMPRDGLVGGVDNSKNGCYRTLQYEWMLRRWGNCFGVRSNVIGVIGLPNKMAVIQTEPEQWMHGSPVQAAVSIREVSEWIIAFTTR